MLHSWAICIVYITLFYRLQLTSQILQCDQSGICHTFHILVHNKCWQTLQKILNFFCARVFNWSRFFSIYSFLLSLLLFSLSIFLCDEDRVLGVSTNEDNMNESIRLFSVLNVRCRLRWYHIVHCIFSVFVSTQFNAKWPSVFVFM